MRKFPLYLCLPLLVFTYASVVHAENTYEFGLATGVTPRYLGSKDYQGQVTPLIAAEFSNGFFINPIDGAGYKKTFANGMFVSSALSYDFGRSDSNRAELPGSSYLRGMGSVPGSLIVSLQVGATVLGDTLISVTLNQPLTHTTRGISGHVDVTKPVLQTANSEVSITGSLHAGNARYTQTFFGVTDMQSTNSGFRPYSAKAGFDSAVVSAAWTYNFSQKWSVRTSGGLTRVLGSSADSPIVQSKDAFFATTALTFRY